MNNKVDILVGTDLVGYVEDAIFYVDVKVFQYVYRPSICIDYEAFDMAEKSGALYLVARDVKTNNEYTAMFRKVSRMGSVETITGKGKVIILPVDLWLPVKK
jgi:hypothetical protein